MTTPEIQEWQFAEPTHTKRGRQRLVSMCRREVGLPFTLAGTTETGTRVTWRIQTPTDARMFVDGASRRVHWNLA